MDPAAPRRRAEEARRRDDGGDADDRPGEGFGRKDDEAWKPFLDKEVEPSRGEYFGTGGGEGPRRGGRQVAKLQAQAASRIAVSATRRTRLPADIPSPDVFRSMALMAERSTCIDATR